MTNSLCNCMAYSGEHQRDAGCRELPPSKKLSSERIADLIEHFQGALTDMVLTEPTDGEHAMALAESVCYVTDAITAMTELQQVRDSAPEPLQRLQRPFTPDEAKAYRAFIEEYFEPASSQPPGPAPHYLDGLTIEQWREHARAGWAMYAARISTPPAAALSDVAAERERQKSVEGWTPEHDDEHGDQSLALAAVCYAMPPLLRSVAVRSFPRDVGRSAGETIIINDRVAVPDHWPMSWHGAWWKPKDKRRDLVRAGALILAEIERLDRATATKEEG